MTRFPDDCLWISWIDREGAIFSSGFSFFKDLPLLLVLLLVLQRFERNQWGFISELSTKDQSVLLQSICVGGTLGEEEVAVNFYAEDKVHSGWSLLGRATTVVGANVNKPHDGKSAEGEHAVGLTVTTSSGMDEEQTEEWRLFYQARGEYRKAYANMIKLHDLVLKVSWPEASRVEEWKVIEHAQRLGGNDKFIKGHIPDVKYARDFERYSTKHIRTFLGLEQDGSSGTRTLRLIVMNRLWPIYDLDGKQFWDAFWQCVACKCSSYCP
jgi:hypothetical protein